MTGMDDPHRTRRVSEIIDFEKLEHETQRLLFVGLVFAFITYPVVGSYFMFRKNDGRAARSFSIQFVFRAARLTKPFELKPPNNSQRPLQREAVPVKQLHPMIAPPADPGIEIREKFSFPVETGISSSVETDLLDPVSGEARADKSSPPGAPVSLRNEMISMNDLDIGQFRAMVVQSPLKKDIRGFVYVSSTWGTQLKVPDRLKRSVINLAEAVNRYTKIEAKVVPYLFLDSREIFMAPFVFITTDTAFELTSIERRNLDTYLKAGGFAIIDNGDPRQDRSQAESSLRQMLRDTLGAGIHFKPIPTSHPLYHCFFDFNEGPPQGAEVSMVQTTTSGVPGETARNTSMSKPIHYLEGIWIDGRLAVVYSNKGYGCKWKDFENNEPQLKMGVNLIVYALIHEGGIAQRFMERYSTDY